MTLPHERARAVNQARDAMYALLDPKRTPGVPKPIRDDFRRILRHYPLSSDVQEALEAARIAATVLSATEHMRGRPRRPPPVD